MNSNDFVGFSRFGEIYHIIVVILDGIIHDKFTENFIIEIHQWGGSWYDSPKMFHVVQAHDHERPKLPEREVNRIVDRQGQRKE